MNLKQWLEKKISETLTVCQSLDDRMLTEYERGYKDAMKDHCESLKRDLDKEIENKKNEQSFFNHNK